MLSFQEMKDRFGVRNADLFRYLQMGDYYEKKNKKEGWGGSSPDQDSCDVILEKYLRQFQFLTLNIIYES